MCFIFGLVIIKIQNTAGPVCNIHINGYCHPEDPRVIRHTLTLLSHPGLQFTYGSLLNQQEVHTLLICIHFGLLRPLALHISPTNRISSYWPERSLLTKHFTNMRTEPTRPPDSEAFGHRWQATVGISRRWRVTAGFPWTLPTTSIIYVIYSFFFYPGDLQQLFCLLFMKRKHLDQLVQNDAGQFSVSVSEVRCHMWGRQSTHSSRKKPCSHFFFFFLWEDRIGWRAEVF